jgi:hypothetical protein
MSIFAPPLRRHAAQGGNQEAKLRENYASRGRRGRMKIRNAADCIAK